MTTTLALLDNARQALMEARDLKDVLLIRAAAEQAKALARAAHLGSEAEGYAREVKLRAERRAGEMLIQMAEAGERAVQGDEVSQRNVGKPTLEELGVTKTESHRWQELGRMPEPEFEERLVALPGARPIRASDGGVRKAVWNVLEAAGWDAGALRPEDWPNAASDIDKAIELLRGWQLALKAEHKMKVVQ